ncbi:MAG TPA: hypothetical protein ENK55_04600 [Actinobacteria bacterium]|nr:hypothetical protein [Actinomycetota bacterium]
MRRPSHRRPGDNVEKPEASRKRNREKRGHDAAWSTDYASGHDAARPGARRDDHPPRARRRRPRRRRGRPDRRDPRRRRPRQAGQADRAGHPVPRHGPLRHPHRPPRRLGRPARPRRAHAGDSRPSGGRRRRRAGERLPDRGRGHPELRRPTPRRDRRGTRRRLGPPPPRRRGDPRGGRERLRDRRPPRPRLDRGDAGGHPPDRRRRGHRHRSRRGRATHGGLGPVGRRRRPGGGARRPRRPQPPPPRAVTGGRTAVAVTPHVLASDAAIATIGAGGTAVDGAVAANAVLGVVAPETCGPGGDLFALVHVDGDAQPRALNASGRAGTGTTPDALATLEEIPIDHPAAITVPGAVDGWLALLDRFGNLDLEAVLAPAIELAEAGFPVSPELARALARLADSLVDQPSSDELYPEGRPPAAGANLRRPRLAATLRRIAAEGRAGFYAGPVAAGIVEAAEGIVTFDDLARPQAEWVEPIAADLFGLRCWTLPPNSQGYLPPAPLWVFSHLDPPRDPHDPRYHHLLVEAYRAVAAERDAVVADPDRAPLAPDDLLDPGRLAAFARRVRRDRVVVHPSPRPTPGGTAYLCVWDGRGMGVSYIQSNYHGIGARRSAGGTGVWLHDRGAGFVLTPGHPNRWTPGRRPLHTLSPTLWTEGDRLRLLLGTRGGDHQPQLLAQVAAHLLHAGLDLEAAQAAPRWVLDRFGPRSPSSLRYESRLDEAVVDGLVELGHTLSPAAAWMEGWGPVSTIRIAEDAQGAADPRVSTAAASVG